MAQGAYETVLGIDAIATGIAAVSGGGGLCASVAGCTIGGPAAALGGVGVAAGTVLSVHGGSVLGNVGNGLNSTLQNIAAKNNWENHGALERHFREHGRGVGATSVEDYVQKAQHFLTDAQRNGYQAGYNPVQGSVQYYDRANKIFGAFDPATGATRYFLSHLPGLVEFR
jgi:hypothetical protein